MWNSSSCPSYKTGRIIILITSLILFLFGLAFIIVNWVIANNQIYQTSSNFNKFKNDLIAWGVSLGLIMMGNAVLGLVISWYVKTKIMYIMNIVFQVIWWILLILMIVQIALLSI